MRKQNLNLGILAHVDAGKTSLTERLLYAAGVIPTVGSVDEGSTQTDTLALERQRGITIKAAVVSFALGDLTVNLIDTPGHPDFIAEVERVLSVLDGAVLVVSAVEGVQPQTRVLMRALRRLAVPTLLFINKIDRRGARCESLLRDLSEKLTPAAVSLGVTDALGTPAARYVPYRFDDLRFREGLLEVLTRHNDALLSAYMDGKTILPTRLCGELAVQTRKALIYPVLFGSAITGAGVDALLSGVQTLLPTARGDETGPVSGTVFKVERGPAGEKVAYARLFSGTVRVRERLPYGEQEGKVTALSVFEQGAAITSESLVAGQIGKFRGLTEVQIGDALGTSTTPSEHHFAPPTLATVVAPANPADKAALHAALTQLAEQDPLINLRQDDTRGELSISLYGEVQKEVVGETLLNNYGLEVAFQETTTICTERPVGVGAAFELLRAPTNPFLATVGLRVEAAPVGTGIRFGLAVSYGSMPPAFFKAVEEAVYETLHQGLYGWGVTDCMVTLTHSGYAARQSSSHFKFDKSSSSTAGDFRHLTPLVLMQALQQAGTTVCEPLHSFRLELPTDSVGPTVALLTKSGAALTEQNTQDVTSVLAGDIPAANVHDFRQRLPGVTRGEGTLETTFSRFEPVRSPFPIRLRIEPDPLERKAYLTHVLGWWGAKGQHDA